MIVFHYLVYMRFNVLLHRNSKSKWIAGLFCMTLIIGSCTSETKESSTIKEQVDTVRLPDTILQVKGQAHFISDSLLADSKKQSQISTAEIIHINTGKIQVAELMAFAKTLIGVPYVYASIDPMIGFDCSGFITYVFRHFNIDVPRSSIGFTDVGKTVAVGNAKAGDFILFTGTNPVETFVGHMGLVVSNDSQGLQFIHATSGRAMAVTVSQLNDQYAKRFIRASRIFHQDD